MNNAELIKCLHEDDLPWSDLSTAKIVYACSNCKTEFKEDDLEMCPNCLVKFKNKEGWQK